MRIGGKVKLNLVLDYFQLILYHLTLMLLLNQVNHTHFYQSYIKLFIIVRGQQKTSTTTGTVSVATGGGAKKTMRLK